MIKTEASLDKNMISVLNLAMQAESGGEEILDSYLSVKLRYELIHVLRNMSKLDNETIQSIANKYETELQTLGWIV